MFKNIVTLGLFLLASLVIIPAYAACANPARAEGSIIYNDDQNTLQVCAGATGTTWEALHKGDIGAGGCLNPTRGEGAVIYNADSNIPQVCSGSTWIALGVVDTAAAGGGCTGPVGVEGKIVYNNDNNVAQYCNGSTWKRIMGPRSTPECPIIGDICNDGTVYAGESPAGGRMYTTRCSAGQTWNGSACAGTIASIAFGNYAVPSPLVNCAGLGSCEKDGRLNTNTLVAFMAGYGNAQYCYDLVQNGKADWYSPSLAELWQLNLNKTIIGNFGIQWYFASNEFSNNDGFYIFFNTASNMGNTAKSNANGANARCVRR